MGAASGTHARYLASPTEDRPLLRASSPGPCPGDPRVRPVTVRGAGNPYFFSFPPSLFSKFHNVFSPHGAFCFFGGKSRF